MGARRADQHMPEFAKRLVAMYDKDGAVSKRCALNPKTRIARHSFAGP